MGRQPAGPSVRGTHISRTVGDTENFWKSFWLWNLNENLLFSLSDCQSFFCQPWPTVVQPAVLFSEDFVPVMSSCTSWDVPYSQTAVKLSKTSLQDPLCSSDILLMFLWLLIRSDHFPRIFDLFIDQESDWRKLQCLRGLMWTPY